MSGFKAWFTERNPECGSAIVPDSQEKVWFAKAGEPIEAGLVRVINELVEYIDEDLRDPSASDGILGTPSEHPNG